VAVVGDGRMSYGLKTVNCYTLLLASFSKPCIIIINPLQKKTSFLTAHATGFAWQKRILVIIQFDLLEPFFQPMHECTVGKNL